MDPLENFNVENPTEQGSAANAKREQRKDDRHRFAARELLL